MIGWDLRLPGIFQHYDVMRMGRASGSVGVGPGSHPGPLCLIWEETEPLSHPMPMSAS